MQKNITEYDIGAKSVWVNVDRIFIYGWTIPLNWKFMTILENREADCYRRLKKKSLFTNFIAFSAANVRK